MSDDYHADTKTVSKTQLNLFCDSPTEYYHTFITGKLNKKRATKPMVFGVVEHSLLLENKSIDDCVAVYPENCFKKNGHVNPVPSAAFRKEIWPRIAVKSNELDKIVECYEACKRSMLWDAIQQSTETERAHYATVHDVDCRCKPDILCDMGEHILVYDLKFCDPSPRAFDLSAKRFRYWLQDAHYSQVITEELGKPVQFRFFAVEPEFPFRVQCYWYEPDQRKTAMDYHRKKLNQLRICIDENIWEDAWPSSLSLNHWDVGEAGPEPLVGFDDEVTEEAYF